ncbi:hypothetical protein DFP73DRAFT_358194 [Morchella snyderi]|nr:hypothetical protein DFP73DRAFT_358194 [Morchella snyderi]
MSMGMPQAANELQQSLDGLEMDNQDTSRGSIKPASPIIAVSLLAVPTPPDSPNFHPPDYFREPLIATSGTALDIALRGGFPYPRIISLSSAHKVERSLLAMHTVASHLVGKPHARAVWVDTEGLFSAEKLGEVIAGNLEDVGENGKKITIGSVLDRITIYRVVDMHELLEVLKEVKSEIQDEAKIGVEMSEVEMRLSEVDRVLDDIQHNKDDEGLPRQGLEEKVIQDSQEEGDEDWDDDEDQRKEEEVKLQKAAVKEQAKPPSPQQTIGVIVVDTITHLLPDLRFTSHTHLGGYQRNAYGGEDKWHQSEKPEAAALFVDFSRAFNLLANSTKTSLLLLNDVTSAPYDEDVYVRSHELPPSRSHTHTGVKPVLGPVYAEYVDLSILLFKQPQEPESVKLQRDGEEREGREIWMAEVLNDRYGDSNDRKGTFRILGDVRLVDI